MNGLSREQLLEKLNELYIELDEYKEMEKDYIDLSIFLLIPCIFHNLIFHFPFL